MWLKFSQISGNGSQTLSLSDVYKKVPSLPLVLTVQGNDICFLVGLGSLHPRTVTSPDSSTAVRLYEELQLLVELIIRDRESGTLAELVHILRPVLHG